MEVLRGRKVSTDDSELEGRSDKLVTGRFTPKRIFMEG
jgi:hypothetical protein